MQEVFQVYLALTIFGIVTGLLGIIAGVWFLWAVSRPLGKQVPRQPEQKGEV